MRTIHTSTILSFFISCSLIAMNHNKVDIKAWQVAPGPLVIDSRDVNELSFFINAAKNWAIAPKPFAAHSREELEEFNASYSLLRFKETATQNHSNIFDKKNLSPKKRLRTIFKEKQKNQKPTIPLILKSPRNIVQKLLEKNSTKKKQYPTKIITKSTGLKQKITSHAKKIKTATNIIKKTEYFNTTLQKNSIHRPVTRSQTKKNNKEVQF